MIKLLNELRSSAAWVLTIIGPGGSGKTSTAWWIIENWFPDDEIAVYKYSAKAIGALPEHIRKRTVRFSSVREILDRRCVIFLDDTLIHFLSRSTSSPESKDFIQNMGIGRHNDFRYILTTQNSILVDKGLFEALDVFSLRCRMGHMQTMTEREEHRDAQIAINDLLEQAADDHGYTRYQRKGLRYCMETEETLYFPDCTWMNDQISKPFRGHYVAAGQLIEG